MELDALDRKILLCLEQNGRQPAKAIARKVRSSGDVVDYRMRRMEKEGVIARHMALVNFSELGYVGYGVFCCFVGENRNDAIEHLKAHERVYWLSEFGGRFDLAFAVMARNDFEFYSIFGKMKEKLHGALGGWKVAIRMQLLQLPRAYLAQDERDEKENVPYFGKTLGNERLDDADFSILKAISQEARMDTMAISKKVKIPASTVAFRLKKLQERKIIQGYSPQISCQKYGFQSFQLFLEVENLDEAKRHKILSYAQGNPNVVFAIETLGEWNFELIYEVKDQKEFQAKVAALRVALPWVGKTESGIIFDHYVKYDQFPLERI
jgi:DNA-binding Lrp family transcriptional regulator